MLGNRLTPFHIRFIACAAAVVAVLVFATSLFTHDPAAGDFNARIKAARLVNDRRELVSIYEQMIRNDPNNIDHHYHYASAAANLPRRHDDENDSAGRPDPKQDQVYSRYSEMSRSADAAERDIGFYCLGLMDSVSKKHDLALISFRDVRNRVLKYLNNSIGHALLRSTDRDAAEQGPTRAARAEACFRREIELNGNLPGAYINLVHLYVKTRRFADLENLTRDPRLKSFVTSQERSILAIHARSWAAYIRLIPRPIVDHFNLISFIGALAGALVWYLYFRRIDVFEPEKHHFLMLTFAGGAFFSMAAASAYDFLEYHGIGMPGSWWGDLIYCIAGIGFIEELAKLAPFLAIVFFTRECNESIDYLVYAAMAALGFATAENIMYIDNLGSRVILVRSMISATLHMLDTSIVAYGLILARYRHWGGPARNLILFFLIACVSHGLFDFPLVSESLPSSAAALAVPVCIAGFAVLGYMISNAVNQSCYFDEKRSAEFARLGVTLACGLLAVACIEYVLMAVQAGPTLAQRAGLKMFAFFVPAVYLLSLGLTRIHPVKGKWKTINGVCEFEPASSDRSDRSD